jgi:hypothetical protein
MKPESIPAVGMLQPHPIFCTENPFVSRLQNPEQLLEQITKDDIFKSNQLDLGFPNGLAAIGMELLTALDGDTSWTSLFPNYFNPVTK